MGMLAAGEAGRPETVDALFARARALLADYQQAGAERLLRRALARLGDGTTAGGLTRARLLLTLANVRAERGHLSEGMAILDLITGRMSVERRIQAPCRKDSGTPGHMSASQDMGFGTFPQS